MAGQIAIVVTLLILGLGMLDWSSAPIYISHVDTWRGRRTQLHRRNHVVFILAWIVLGLAVVLAWKFWLRGIIG